MCASVEGAAGWSDDSPSSRLRGADGTAAACALEALFDAIVTSGGGGAADRGRVVEYEWEIDPSEVRTETKRNGNPPERNAAKESWRTRRGTADRPDDEETSDRACEARGSTPKSRSDVSRRRAKHARRRAVSVMGPTRKAEDRRRQ